MHFAITSFILNEIALRLFLSCYWKNSYEFYRWLW